MPSQRSDLTVACPRIDPWGFLPSGPTAPALNMAIDEALLNAVARVGRPIFRSYAWSVPAATFGYFQRHQEVAAWSPLRPLLRRPTGGGLVPHDEDWTYSIVVPPGHPWYELRAEESYQRVHLWLREAFRKLGVTTELATGCDPQGPGRCFVGAEKNDLLHRGRKLAGAAQRRNRLGLLIQGSVQPPPSGHERTHWETAMCSVAAETAGVTWMAETVGPWMVDAAALAASKYILPAYNERK